MVEKILIKLNHKPQAIFRGRSFLFLWHTCEENCMAMMHCAMIYLETYCELAGLATAEKEKELMAFVSFWQI